MELLYFNGALTTVVVGLILALIVRFFFVPLKGEAGAFLFIINSFVPLIPAAIIVLTILKNIFLWLFELNED